MTKAKSQKPREPYIPDYHHKYSRGLKKTERNKLNIGDIWINGAVCLNCADFIRSRNKHDFRTCRCGCISVDGGSHYIHRQFKENRKSYKGFMNIIELFADVEEFEQKAQTITKK